MSEFKFACPVCGQHITCDARASGTQMECPTCFRKLVVPQASAAGSPNLILTAAQVATRPHTHTEGADVLARPASQRQFPFAAVTFVVVLIAAAVGAYVFRDKLFGSALNQPAVEDEFESKKATNENSGPVALPANGKNWKLNLAGVTIPDVPACGRISGRDFLMEHATLTDGALKISRGDTGLTIHLFARKSEDLAGKTINLETNRTSSPKVTLQWKDARGLAQRSEFREGYALRLDFGPVAGTRLPGNIYLCVPDEAKSYVAGSFSAKIKKPPPPEAGLPPPPQPATPR